MRRGLGEPESARAFLSAEDAHDPRAFAGMGDAVALILRHVATGSRITVHGDYDVDGVCATALLLRALRRIGADAEYFLPSRVDDGYGLAATTVERLAERGTSCWSRSTAPSPPSRRSRSRRSPGSTSS